MPGDVHCTCGLAQMLEKVQEQHLKIRTLQMLLDEQQTKIEYFDCTKKVFYDILPN